MTTFDDFVYRKEIKLKLLNCQQLYMSQYKRPNFDGDWWESVQDYLRENPEEGFREDDVKEFIKYTVNKKMNQERNIDLIQKQLEEKLEELS